jgi:hypothetical protein
MAMTAVTGCATLPDGKRWGEDASFRVGWHRVADAALQAAKSPAVWAPLAAGAVMQIDHWDHDVSRWAVDNTPIFGSGTNAHDASDELAVAAGALYLASVLAAPGGDAGSDRWSAKLKGFTVGLGAIAAESITVEGLKAATNRERPNGGVDSFSFRSHGLCSGRRHPGRAEFRGDAHERGNANGPDHRRGCTDVCHGLGASRSGAHYPSDVLVGISIGNFFGRMFDDAFLGDHLSQRFAVSLEPARGGAETGLELALLSRIWR